MQCTGTSSRRMPVYTSTCIVVTVTSRGTCLGSKDWEVLELNSSADTVPGDLDPLTGGKRSLQPTVQIWDETHISMPLCGMQLSGKIQEGWYLYVHGNK